MQKIKNIDFLKKGSIDFFLTFFTVFNVVQSNIFNDKSHSYLKRNLTVDLVCRARHSLSQSKSLTEQPYQKDTRDFRVEIMIEKWINQNKGETEKEIRAMSGN